MALFGSAARKQAMTAKPMAEAGGASASPVSRPQRRGFLGGLVRRQDGDPGTALNYFLFGLNGVNSMRDNRREDEVLRMARQDRELEMKDRDLQGQARQAAYGALPENLRPLGPILTPEALSRAVMPPPPEYEIDDAGRPYTIQNGQVQYGQGQVYRRPPQSSVQAPPSGYRFTPDSNLEPIPGGPADMRQNAEGRQRAAGLEASMREMQTALSALDQAEALVGPNTGERGGDWNPLNDTTGFMGGVMANVGGSAAHDLQQALEPIKAVIGFDRLQEMRRNSATGGALGNVAVREIELLQRTIRSLEQSQSREQFRANLNAVRRQLQTTMQAMQSARAEMEGVSTSSQAPMQGRGLQDMTTDQLEEMLRRMRGDGR